MKEVYSFKCGAEFPRYPRCGTTMEREYQCFCDRCGQRLNWSGFNECEMKYMGWDGPEDDEDDSNVDCKQVDDANQKDSAKINRKPRFPVAPSISQGQKKNSLVEKIIWDSAGIDVYNNSIFISHMHL